MDGPIVDVSLADDCWHLLVRMREGDAPLWSDEAVPQQILSISGASEGWVFEVDPRSRALVMCDPNLVREFARALATQGTRTQDSTLLSFSDSLVEDHARMSPSRPASNLLRVGLHPWSLDRRSYWHFGGMNHRSAVMVEAACVDGAPGDVEVVLELRAGEIVGLYTRLEAAVVTIAFEARIVGDDGV